MARSTAIRFFQPLLVLVALLGTSAARSPSLVAQATATIQAAARVVSTEVPRAGQSNGLSLARETLEAVSKGFDASIERRRELNGTAVVARVVMAEVDPEVAPEGPSKSPAREKLVRVTVQYAAN